MKADGAIAQRRQHKQQLEEAPIKNPVLATDLSPDKLTPEADDIILERDWNDDWAFVVFRVINNEQHRSALICDHTPTKKPGPWRLYPGRCIIA